MMRFVVVEGREKEKGDKGRIVGNRNKNENKFLLKKERSESVVGMSVSDFLPTSTTMQRERERDREREREM